MGPTGLLGAVPPPPGETAITQLSEKSDEADKGTGKPAAGVSKSLDKVMGLVKVRGTAGTMSKNDGPVVASTELLLCFDGSLC